MDKDDNHDDEFELEIPPTSIEKDDFLLLRPGNTLFPYPWIGKSVANENKRKVKLQYIEKMDGLGDMWGVGKGLVILKEKVIAKIPKQMLTVISDKKFKMAPKVEEKLYNFS